MRQWSGAPRVRLARMHKENDAALLAHVRREDDAEREHEDTALFKRCKKKVDSVLEGPPTTTEGITKRLTNIFLPAIRYLHQRCVENADGDDGDRVNAMKFFQGALLLNPNHIRNTPIADLRSLADQLCCSHPKLNTDEFKAGLRNEVANLKAWSMHNYVVDKKSYPFLSNHWRCKNERPFCYKAAKIVAISQPSSAAIERVFSIYRQMFSNNQRRTLADVKTVSVQLNHHDRTC